jgi:hypothetical protein
LYVSSTNSDHLFFEWCLEMQMPNESPHQQNHRPVAFSKTTEPSQDVRKPVIPPYQPSPETDTPTQRVKAADMLAQLNLQFDAYSGTDARELRKMPILATEISPWRVIFQTITPEAKAVGVEVHDVAVVGRSDSSDTNAIPDLDLSPYDAQNHGVSRRHAIMLPSDDGLCLIDLDSTNGTWINGVYLQPGQKYPLRNGDRVEFGRLRLVVRVVGAMLQKQGEMNNTGVMRSKPQRK